jgi:hypothetical protein
VGSRINLALEKQFHIGERYRVLFIAPSFNLTNPRVADRFLADR